MAIVITIDTFPLSCICVVMYDFHAALKDKSPMVIRVLFGIALQICNFFFIFPNYVYSIFIVDLRKYF